MLRNLFLSLVALCALAGGETAMAQSVAKDDAATVVPADTFAVTDVRDLALIYQGGAHRIDWTGEQFAPYVSHKFADGNEEWLFDGYLFLEFKDGRGAQYSPGYDKRNATKAGWEWYLDRLFERGKSLDALDKVITEKKKTIGDPGFRHKIALTAFVPLKGQTDWGTLDSDSLDFNRQEDQVKASQWFVDQLAKRFAEAGYKNLDLWGIYWIDEDMVHTNDFPKLMSDYIHDKGLKFIWIPYFKAPGHERWRELGFDIAYHQPNHFFEAKIADSRLDEAVDEALKYGMAIEFECDERALSQTPECFAPRMDAYINAYDRRGVWKRSALAYYTGSHLLLDFVKNPSAENAALADRFSRHIVERRNQKLK